VLDFSDYGLLLSSLRPDADEDGIADIEETVSIGSAPASSDTDGDGFDDGDEVFTYATSPLLRDTDGDGQTDFEEAVVAGSDPQDPASFFRIAGLQIQAGPAIRLSWPSVPNRYYSVWHSPTPDWNGSHAIRLFDSLPSTPPYNSLTILQGTTPGSSGFFRIDVTNPFFGGAGAL